MMSTRIKVIILTLFLAAGTAPAAWAEGGNNGKPANDKQQQEEVMCENQNEQALESLNESIKTLRASIDDLNKRIIAIENERSEAEGLSFGNPHLIAICSLLLSVVALLTSVVAEIQLFRENRKEQPAKEEPEGGKEDKTPKLDFNNFNRGEGGKSDTEKPVEAIEGEPVQKQDEQKPEAEQAEAAEPQVAEPEAKEDPQEPAEPQPGTKPAKLYKAAFNGTLLTANESGGVFLINEENGTFSYLKDPNGLKSFDNVRGAIKNVGSYGDGKKAVMRNGKVKVKSPGRAWDIVDSIIIEYK